MFGVHAVGFCFKVVFRRPWDLYVKVGFYPDVDCVNGRKLIFLADLEHRFAGVSGIINIYK